MQPQKVQQDRRAAILQTSLKLFASEGYFNTSVHDIRKKADVSIGTIYHYFANKEAVAQALYHELISRLTKALLEIFSSNDSSRDCCRAVTEYLFEMAESSPEEMHYILYARHQEFMPGEKPICSSRPFELILGMVVRGIEKGEIRPLNPAVATTSIFGGTMRLIHLWLDGALPGPLSSYLEEAWECGWLAVAREKE